MTFMAEDDTRSSSVVVENGSAITIEDSATEVLTTENSAATADLQTESTTVEEKKDTVPVPGRSCQTILCQNTLDRYMTQVKYLVKRVAELKRSPEDAVITVINIEDPNGFPLADSLLPGTDWKSFQQITQILANREDVQEYLDMLDIEAAAKLEEMSGLAVVVIDHGYFEVFPAPSVG